MCVIRDDIIKQGFDNKAPEEKIVKKEGNLARSAQKGLKVKKAKMDILRESISKAMLKKRNVLQNVQFLTFINKNK